MSRREVDQAGRWAAGAVAQRLGIAPSTLRTWNHRYGVGPVQESAGRHRLYSEADVAELVQIQQTVAGGLPIKAAVEIVRRERAVPMATRPDPPALVGTPVRTPAAVNAAAQRLDYVVLVRAFDEALGRRGALHTWERLARPALVRAGEEVMASGACMDVELMIVRALLTSLHRAAAPAPRRPNRPVLLACMQGEDHSLATEVLAAALAERQVPAICLGASVANTALVETAARLRPRALVLTATRAATARVAALRRAGEHAGLVLACGPGWATRRLPAGVEQVDDLHRALELTAGQDAQHAR